MGGCAAEIVKKDMMHVPMQAQFRVEGLESLIARLNILYRDINPYLVRDNVHEDFLYDVA
jgi:hypothetical protein